MSSGDTIVIKLVDGTIIDFSELQGFPSVAVAPLSQGGDHERRGRLR